MSTTKMDVFEALSVRFGCTPPPPAHSELECFNSVHRALDCSEQRGVVQGRKIKADALNTQKSPVHTACNFVKESCSVILSRELHDNCIEYENCEEDRSWHKSGRHPSSAEDIAVTTDHQKYQCLKLEHIRAGRMPICLYPMHFMVITTLTALVQDIHGYLELWGFEHEFDGSVSCWRVCLLDAEVPGGWPTTADVKVYEARAGRGVRVARDSGVEEAGAVAAAEVRSEGEVDGTGAVEVPEMAYFAVEISCIDDMGDKFLLGRFYWALRTAVLTRRPESSVSTRVCSPDKRLEDLQDVLVNLSCSLPLTTNDLNVVQETLFAGLWERYEVVLTGIARKVMEVFKAAPSNQHRLQTPVQSALVILGYLCREQVVKSMVLQNIAFVDDLSLFKRLVSEAYKGPENRDRDILEHRISSILE